MAHPEQREWCMYVKSLYPEYFTEDNNVLDFGSLDINGSNRYLFDNSCYTGIDIGQGKNVDIISPAHMYNHEQAPVDVIISTEMFEHDQYIDKSLINMISILRSGGLFLFTCATHGRPEHGTRRTSAVDSPFTSNIEGWSDYYRNLAEDDIRSFLDIDVIFEKYEFSTIQSPCDLRFFGIKNNFNLN